jgi:hypothetical protein
MFNIAESVPTHEIYGATDAASTQGALHRRSAKRPVDCVAFAAPKALGPGEAVGFQLGEVPLQRQTILNLSLPHLIPALDPLLPVEVVWES